MRWLSSMVGASFLTKAKRGSGPLAATVTKVAPMIAAVMPIAAAPRRPRAQRRIAATATKMINPEPAEKIREPDLATAMVLAQITKLVRQANDEKRNFLLAWTLWAPRVS